LKSNNPSNQISQAAKTLGLTYWEYIESTQSQFVQKFVWGVKKETRKEKRETMDKVISHLGSSGNPMARLFAQMRSLIGKRSAY